MSQVPRLTPPGSIPLVFDAADQRRAHASHGANCGPGALAAMTGITPLQAVAVLPGWKKGGGTKETQLFAALDTLGLCWARCGPCFPHYGIARIQWDGPWFRDPDPFEALRHSHYVGVLRERDALFVFDINAIGWGGWMTGRDWSEGLVPLLLEREEPCATGAWWITDCIEILIPKTGWPKQTKKVTDASLQFQSL